VAEKIAVYLAAGSAGVFVVDPVRRTLSIHDGSLRILTEADVVRHDALPGFALSLAEVFGQEG
jgi:Uma2 family endonuclease